VDRALDAATRRADTYTPERDALTITAVSRDGIFQITRWASVEMGVPAAHGDERTHRPVMAQPHPSVPSLVPGQSHEALRFSAATMSACSVVRPRQQLDTDTNSQTRSLPDHRASGAGRKRRGYQWFS
jgi:hypothetical protein